MNKANNKLRNASILIFMLFLFSITAYAKPFTDSFRGGLIQINDFFASEQYKAYAAAIDFFFFSFLFIAIYMMGARYAFKEVKRPEQVIVILLGLMTAFLMVLGGFSATILLPYMNWLLYVLLFILIWLMLKSIKSKFWRFVLALLLTLLIIGLLQWLYNNLTTPDISADTGFLSSLFEGFKGIKFPEISGQPGVPPYLQDLFGTATTTPTGPELTTLPTVPTPTVKPEGKGGIFGSGVSWWWLLLLLLLVFAFKGPRKLLGSGLNRLRGRQRGEKGAATEQPTGEHLPEEEIIDDLINDITNAINQKIAILKKIRGVVKDKETGEQRIQGFLDLYHKKIVDPLFYGDRDAKEYQELMGEHQEVTDLIKIELELEKDLLELMRIEDELIGKGKLPLGTWEREKFSGRLIEFTSNKTKKEWYGKLYIWYYYVKNLQKYIEQEYTTRLVQSEDLVQGREEAYQRPELAVPQGIPDFYEKVFSLLDASFIVLAGGGEDILEEISRKKKNVVAILGVIESKNYKHYKDGIIHTIKRQIVKYYVWTKEEERIDSTIKNLTDATKLEQWLKKGWAERWHDIKDKEGSKLIKIFKNEKKMFIGANQEPGLFKNLLTQLKHLQHIKALLQALKSLKVSMTQLQELKIDKISGEQWIDATKEAKKQPGLVLNVPHSVHTRIQEGIGPFNVACYVNMQRRGEIKPVEKKHDEVRWTFEEIGITAQGTYAITFRCISIAEKVYERMDMKTIKIYVGGATAAHPTSTPQPPAVAPLTPVPTTASPSAVGESTISPRTIIPPLSEESRRILEKNP